MQLYGIYIDASARHRAARYKNRIRAGNTSRCEFAARDRQNTRSFFFRRMRHLYVAYALKCAARNLNVTFCRGFGTSRNRNGIQITCGESAELSAHKNDITVVNLDGSARCCRNRCAAFYGQAARYYMQTKGPKFIRHARNRFDNQLAAAGNSNIAVFGINAFGKGFVYIIRIPGIKGLAADSGECSARNRQTVSFRKLNA